MSDVGVMFRARFKVPSLIHQGSGVGGLKEQGPSKVDDMVEKSCSSLYLGVFLSSAEACSVYLRRLKEISPPLCL